MWQPHGEPFMLGVRDPKNPKKYLSWAINEYVIPDKPDKNNVNHVRLWMIMTLPQHRRRGCATQIVRLMQGVHDKIESNAISPEGDALLKKCGFKQIKSIHKNKQDVYLWTKNESE